jgi:succinyl-CoA synthetase beta subunit
VHKVLIEEPCEIARELYLGAVIDRSTNSVVFMASTEGGVDIEKVAEETPELIFKIAVDPMLGVLGFQGRSLAFKLGLSGKQIGVFCKILSGLAKMFNDYDLSLLEINPLVITKSGELLCLDGKIKIDCNALYRQPKIRDLNDPTQSDERENKAQQWELNYIALDGNIGCMVNGAGLAMATMDLIKLHGGEPANFLDVGGGATAERVAEAFKIILSDDNVKVVLVNIFGGIVRCDLIADGIISAIAEVDVKCPVVVRLEGNNAEAGLKKLAESGLNILPADSFDTAAKAAVDALQ